MPFDHDYIETHDVTNRYVRKTLTAVERREFEQHLPDCPECLDRLALAQVFEHEQSNGEFRGADDTHPATSLAAQFARLPVSRQKLALAIAALLVGGVPTAFFLGSWIGFRQQNEARPISRPLLLVDPTGPGFTTYGVAVTDAAGKVVRATTGISLPSGKLLGLPVDLDGLPPGDYRIAVRGRRADGSTMLVQSYVVRAVGRQP